MALPIIPGYYNGNIEGRLIGVKMNSQFFKCETGCTFGYDVEMLPASSVSSGYYEESIPGKISWTMTVNGNLSLAALPYHDFGHILEKVQDRERVYLEMVTRTGINPYFSIAGWAWPQNGGIDAQATGNATWNNSFKGDGEFVTDWNQFGGLIINAMPADANKPYIVDTTGWD